MRHDDRLGPEAALAESVARRAMVNCLGRVVGFGRG